MSNKSQGNDTTACDITPAEAEVAKSEDDVPEWFVRAFKREEDPCWENYVMVGMKPDPNGNGQVPNCVPEEDADEPDRMGSADMSVVDAWNEHISEKMTDDNDPGGTGNGDGESVSKQLDAGGVSEMLGMVGEKSGISGSSSIKDFVMACIEDGDVEESEVRNLSVLLNGGSGGDAEEDGMGDAEEDGMGGDEEMSGEDDEGIDLDADGKSEGDDVEKSVGDDRIDRIESAVESLADTVDDLQKQVEDEPWADKMSGDQGLSDRIAKDLTGADDADVARKAIREQVAKNDGGGGPDVDYEGITDDEDVTAEASDPDDGGDGSLHSKAANTRMTGGD